MKLRDRLNAAAGSSRIARDLRTSAGLRAGEFELTSNFETGWTFEDH
jgi:hypothetical protein